MRLWFDLITKRDGRALLRWWNENAFWNTCGGLCFSVPASNLQAFLGVETWRCDRCKQLYGHNFGGHR